MPGHRGSLTGKRARWCYRSADYLTRAHDDAFFRFVISRDPVEQELGSGLAHCTSRLRHGIEPGSHEPHPIEIVKTYDGKSSGSARSLSATAAIVPSVISPSAVNKAVGLLLFESSILGLMLRPLSRITAGSPNEHWIERYPSFSMRFNIPMQPLPTGVEGVRSIRRCAGKSKELLDAPVTVPKFANHSNSAMALRQEPCYRIVSALLVVHSHEIGAKAVHLTVDLDDWDARRDDGNQVLSTFRIAWRHDHPIDLLFQKQAD